MHHSRAKCSLPQLAARNALAALFFVAEAEGKLKEGIELESLTIGRRPWIAR
jgi:hypothetical protein